MSRSLAPGKLEALKRALRQGMTVRGAAEAAGVSVGTAGRTKKEMGLGRQEYHGVHHKLKTMPIVEEEEKSKVNPNPSPAALRLAQFDKVVARAIKRPAEEDE